METRRGDLIGLSDPVPGSCKAHSAKTRVVVGDRRQLYAEALVDMLSDDLATVVGWTSSVDEMNELATINAPQIIILAGPSPADDLLETIQSLRQSGMRIPAILVTDDTRIGFLQRVRERQIEGLVSLASGSKKILGSAISRIAVGGDFRWYPSTHDVDERVNPLNDREVRVLQLALRGLSSTDISQTVFMARGTVRNYLSAAIRKVGARNRVEAGRVALELGWV